MPASEEKSSDLLRYIEYELNWFHGLVAGLVCSDSDHIIEMAAKRNGVARSNLKELRSRIENGDDHQ